MRSTRIQKGITALGLTVAAFVMPLANAADVTFSVPLDGKEQVPPVSTSATGKADMTWDAATRHLTWTVSYSGLSSDATMAHIHGPAATGKNAGVAVWLSQKGSPMSSPIKGEATLTPDQAKELASGDMYINVHTKDHPNGEIRGQLNPPKG